MEIPFIGETYPHRSLNVSAQNTLNMYPELISNPEAKKEYVLIGTPGSETFADFSEITQAPCRGLHASSLGQLYGVYGQYLIRVGSDGSVDETWLVSGGSTRVFFADNGKYLVFVDGQNMWLLNTETDTLTTQSNIPFTEPQQIAYIGQRFVSFGKGSNQYYWSAVGPDAPLTWEGFGFASAEGSADPILAIGVSDGEIVLLGPKSYEVFRLTADDEAPFARVNGSFTQIGIGAPNSIGQIAGTIFWLGSSVAGKNQVFYLKGYNAQPISNHAISFQLDKADSSSGQVNTTSDAVGGAYQQEGHVFYVLNLIQGNETWVYDLTTAQWHQRSSRDEVFNIENRWHPLYFVFAYERVLAGNGAVPQVLELKLDKYTEYDGRKIKRKRVGPISWDDLAEVFHRDFIVDMETGVGLTPNVQGQNPQAMLRWSNDSGHTWSSERWAPIGKVGKYNTRVRWNKLGRARNRVYELTVTDPVKQVWLGASATMVKSLRR